MTKPLHKSLKELREQYNISQNELARRADISVGFISKLEAGLYKTLSIDKSKQLAEGLGMTFRDFLAAVGLLDGSATPNATQMITTALRSRRFSDDEINEIVGHVNYLESKRKGGK